MIYPPSAITPFSVPILHQSFLKVLFIQAALQLYHHLELIRKGFHYPIVPPRQLLSRSLNHCICHVLNLLDLQYSIQLIINLTALEFQDTGTLRFPYLTNTPFSDCFTSSVSFSQRLNFGVPEGSVFWHLSSLWAFTSLT